MQSSGVLWQTVLGEIELSVSRGNYVTWFKNTSLLKQEEDKLVVGVPNIFIKQQLEKKYGDLISKTLDKNGVAVSNIEYKVAAPRADADGGASTMPARTAETAETSEAGTSARTATKSEPAAKPSTGIGSGLGHSYRQGLNERYTFDSFVVGGSNELAFAACQAVTQQPGTKYNPLFLYGGVGIGKTHLIQAVGNAILAKNPDSKVLYISTEQFVQEFVDALRFRKTAAFARHYRTADVLIVDDVQFIAGKEKMQEEFFHTFNALHQANKQIILSADKPPKEIPTLEDRLRSRFTGGMGIDMQVPDFETRCAIVQTKAGLHDSELDNEVVEYLANNLHSNIRELEGALNQLLAYCEMRNLEPTLAIASNLLNVNKTRPKHLSAKQIIERTARHFQIPVEDLLGPKRDKDIVVPRQIAMYMLRNELKLSFPKIARELGRKDHTTAIHSVEKIERETRTDSSLRMAISEIREHLYA
ncbi:MAG TPA: chromosomal replication initiator protein DnaA [Candidatus Saccharimonadales bacterium]|nr:chromosomal replication initiator protein DnaA [Candidatus Saccharimonadales bacterium]